LFLFVFFVRWKTPEHFPGTRPRCDTTKSIKSAEIEKSTKLMNKTVCVLKYWEMNVLRSFAIVDLNVKLFQSFKEAL